MHSAPPRDGISPESVLAMVIGSVLLLYGLLALLLGGSDLGAEFPDGTVNGESWLGIEGNGWTNLLFMTSGVLLIACSPRRAAAKTAATSVGLVLGAAAAIAIADGDDVLGIFAANGGTMAAWGFSAVALILVALIPRRSEPGEEPDWKLRDERSTARFGRADDAPTSVNRIGDGGTPSRSARR
jgi:hypothetical protein